MTWCYTDDGRGWEPCFGSRRSDPIDTLRTAVETILAIEEKTFGVFRSLGLLEARMLGVPSIGTIGKERQRDMLYTVH